MLECRRHGFRVAIDIHLVRDKKDNKIEENDLEEWLNERLRDKITMILRGKIIDRISFVQGFGIDFKGDISTHFHRATYVSDDFIFMEKDKAECLYYITVELTQEDLQKKAEHLEYKVKLLDRDIKYKYQVATKEIYEPLRSKDINEIYFAVIKKVIPLD